MVTCRSDIAKLEIQDGSHGGSHGCHLENLIFASSPEPKGQLTRNLVSIRVTRLENLFFPSSELKGQLT